LPRVIARCEMTACFRLRASGLFGIILAIMPICATAETFTIEYYDAPQAVTWTVPETVMGNTFTATKISITESYQDKCINRPAYLILQAHIGAKVIALTPMYDFFGGPEGKQWPSGSGDDKVNVTVRWPDPAVSLVPVPLAAGDYISFAGPNGNTGPVDPGHTFIMTITGNWKLPTPPQKYRGVGYAEGAIGTCH